MVRRLEELGLTRDGTWDWFATYGGITDEQAHQFSVICRDLISITRCRQTDDTATWVVSR